MALPLILRLGSQYCGKQIKIRGRKLSSVPLNPVSGLNVFDSYSKKKSPLLTKHPNILTWYICGPTVYDFAHIGHAWCYVNFDIMRRIMEQYFNLNVIQVMNITDIDDKIIQKAIDEKVDFKEVSSKYEMAFLNDLDSLSVQKPTVLTKVSDFIPQIISFIEALLHRELAYTTDDGSVYFNLNTYVKRYEYGKLKPFQMSTVELKNSRNYNDFALWKAAKSDTEPSWTPSWGGKGRPGWHIECSAMASYVFGPSVDVHSGGIDLLFPHHENEEAQCCAYHEIPQWVGHWIHSNLLRLSGGTKMSKSLKNTVSIKEFLQTYSADQFRMMCLLSSYRNDMELTEASLRLAKDFLDVVREFFIECRFFLRNNTNMLQSSIDSKLLLTSLVETESMVKSHLGDDFNTAQATSAVRKLILLTRKEINNSSIGNRKATDHNPGIAAVASVLNFVSKYFSNLGLTSAGNLVNTMEMDASLIIDNFVEFRSQIRQCALDMKSNQQGKDDSSSTVNTRKILLTACDRIREDLKLKGIQLKDQEKTTTWTLVR
ncbi:probable cysteine--tRNA ligase, mitochondrial [Daphnia carinata]|uniref:probable cysteine--tRNA ligase, mitochondrial n=1 Tax=Daphnia carinata TaxID=120202 RepID=UPI00257E69A4|nr:probable cysteine--tRNA ligase, mitochondrial [Daphnia carinata]